MGFLRNEITTDDMFLHVYGESSKEGLDQKIDQLFISQGYKLAGGQNGQRIYEKGNRTLRILLGAMIKYYKVGVQTTVTAPSEIKCEVRSQSSGMSGGLIGMNQVKNEMRSLFTIFQGL